MGWRWAKFGVVIGAVLISAGVLRAQSTQPTAVQLPKGIYETQRITQNDAPAETGSPTSQPSVALASGPRLDVRRLLLAMAIVLGLIFAMRWAGHRFFPSAGVPRSG